MLTEPNSSSQITNRDSDLHPTLRKCNPVHILTTSQHTMRFSITVRDVKSRQSAFNVFNVSDGRFACGFSYFPLYPEDGGDTFLRNVG
jgi:hypothetical protein